MGVKKLNEEKGMAFLLSILLLLVVTLIGISAVSTANYDIQISGNKRISEQAFYVAEAGLNEFFARFRDGATGKIDDAVPTNATWRLYLALNTEGATRVGYSLSNANHLFVNSLQNSLDFGVEVRHKVNIAGGVISYAGNPVYIVTANGFTPEGGNKVIEVELEKRPILDPQAALYSERPVDILGNSTYIQGNDQCGNPPKNKPGIATTLANGNITISGTPDIEGSPDKQYNTTNADLRGMVDFIKSSADFKYSYNGNQILTGYSDSWGVPNYIDTKTPLTYGGKMNIVYFDMQGTKTLKLSGGSHGAGILIVDGNLELNGAFNWYGLIIVMGALDYTGGGEKNVTGGIWTGETATVSVDVGGNAGIIYCSAVGDQLKNHVSPFRLTRWREVF